MEKYIIVSGQTMEKLQQAVNEKILAGYRPCGGVAPYLNSWLITNYAQALWRDK